MSRISIESLLSQTIDKLRRGSILCSTKYLVSKNYRDKRGREFHDFPSQLFCLTVPNHFVEESFCVSESFGYGKKLCLRVEYHDLL